MTTEPEFLDALREELVGTVVGGPQWDMTVAELRARYCYGQVLLIARPDHDHPHRLLDVALTPRRDCPWEIEVEPTYDPCPS